MYFRDRIGLAAPDHDMSSNPLLTHPMLGKPDVGQSLQTILCFVFRMDGHYPKQFCGFAGGMSQLDERAALDPVG
jgi:hypothetical protein